MTAGPSIRRVLRIARRDYVAAVFTKGFLIGLIVLPLMMCGGLVVIPLMEHVEVADRRITVLDHTRSLREPLADAAKAHNRTLPGKSRRGPGLDLDFVEPESSSTALESQRLDLADRIRGGRLHAFVEIGPDVLKSEGAATNAWIRYYARGSALDDARNWMDRTINQEVRRKRLKGAGFDPVRLAELTGSVPVEGMTLPTRDSATGRVQSARRENEALSMGVSFGMILLTMILVLMGAAPLLQGVIEEKSQRIAEVLLGCATPWEIMVGKLLAGMGVMLTGLAFYGTTGGLTLSSAATLSSLPLGLLPWMAVFMMVAVLMYGAVALALGSACSDLKDAQHLQLPLMLPVMAPVMLALPVLRDPNGGFATVLSFVPPFTPLLMLLRMSVPGGIPAWQPWLGLLLVVMTVAFTLWLAGRIFRVGILMQGKLPKFSEILRWGIRG